MAETGSPGDGRDLIATRKAIYDWSGGDPLILSARCAKAEQRIRKLESAVRLAAEWFEDEEFVAMWDAMKDALDGDE